MAREIFFFSFSPLSSSPPNTPWRVFVSALTVVWHNHPQCILGYLPHACWLDYRRQNWWKKKVGAAEVTVNPPMYFCSWRGIKLLFGVHNILLARERAMWVHLQDPANIPATSARPSYHPHEGLPNVHRCSELFSNLAVTPVNNCQLCDCTCNTSPPTFAINGPYVNPTCTIRGCVSAQSPNFNVACLISHCFLSPLCSSGFWLSL